MIDNVTIVPLGSEDLIWPFHEAHPHFKTGGHSQQKVDPFPCYPHDDADIYNTMLDVVRVFAPPTPLTVFQSYYEGVGRTNAWASYVYAYEGDNYVFQGTTIFFDGKRVPPHPAMTRYLVGHEYGHCVSYWIALRDFDDANKYTKVIDDYAEMRGLKDNAYGGDRWHDNPGEVFACDFRLLCGIEEEHWPHHGIERPDGKVLRWLRDRITG